MAIITEEFLRKLEKENTLKDFILSNSDKLTPSAKDFLNSKKQSGQEDKNMNNDDVCNYDTASKQSVNDTQDKKFRYRHYETGAMFEKKPEYMTQLFGNELVSKNHKRIVLRGKFDTLQAFVVQYWKKYSNVKKLNEDFSNAYRYVRDLFISEITDKPFEERDVLGCSMDQLKDMTHNTVKYFKTGHMFEINSGYQEDVIDLNCLRAMSRECEIAAVDAFCKEGSVERADILRALNRLSSIFYLMMLKAGNGDYR